MAELKKETPMTHNEQEIDLIELALKVWNRKKLIFKACGIAALVGLVVAYSIPREYTTQVLLASESSSKSGGGSMGALAAMAGISLGSASGPDALSPTLYPEIVGSTPFLTGLFNIEVTDKKGKFNTTLYDYMAEHQRSPWWSAIVSAPFKALGWVLSIGKSEEPQEEGTNEVNVFNLSKKEAAIAGALQKRVQVAVDKKTGAISLTVMMQDPLISATLADTVTQCLQNYVTEYRTNKARKDLEYVEKLYIESKQDYYTAQQKYATYTDENRNVVLQSFLAEQTRLQNDMNLAYGVYSQMSQQRQAAKAKVQEVTPIYTIVQPASIPLRASKPNKMMMLIGFVFLAGVGSVGWILFGDFFQGFGKKPKEEDVSETAQN